MAEDRPSLRRRLRAARRAVPASERPAAAAAIDRAIARLGLPKPGSRIAAFEPYDGEIDPSVVLRRARRLGCRLVLVPLVGFDRRGYRLGVGGGFYDRHFAFLRHRQSWQRPILLGIAFEVQRLDHFAEQSHDVPLWGVVTERGIYGHAAGIAGHRGEAR
mgnify:CR=1 FL=1